MYPALDEVSATQILEQATAVFMNTYLPMQSGPAHSHSEVHSPQVGPHLQEAQSPV